MHALAKYIVDRLAEYAPDSSEEVDAIHAKMVQVVEGVLREADTVLPLAVGPEYTPGLLLLDAWHEWRAGNMAGAVLAFYDEAEPGWDVRWSNQDTKQGPLLAAEAIKRAVFEGE